MNIKEDVTYAIIVLTVVYLIFKIYIQWNFIECNLIEWKSNSYCFYNNLIK